MLAWQPDKRTTKVEDLETLSFATCIMVSLYILYSNANIGDT